MVLRNIEKRLNLHLLCFFTAEVTLALPTTPSLTTKLTTALKATTNLKTTQSPPLDSPIASTRQSTVSTTTLSPITTQSAITTTQRITTQTTVALPTTEYQGKSSLTEEPFKGNLSNVLLQFDCEIRPIGIKK